MKPLIVGEAFSRLGDGANAFTGPSGDRLQQLSGCRSYLELQACFDLTNLCNGYVWNLKQAQRRVSNIVLPELVILAGRKVEGAFGFGAHQWFYPHDPDTVEYRRWPDTTFYTMPHPSGLSRYWNDPENVTKAAMFLGMMSMVHLRNK